MASSNYPLLSERDQQAWIEQYKILVESLNKLNDTRENSNNFWVGINGFGISAIAYLREIHQIPQAHKSLLLVTLVIVGMVFCTSWLSYLRTIKQSIEIRSSLLVRMEKQLPMTLFSKIFTHSHEQKGRSALTTKEMFIPYLFAIGYTFFAILLFFFPEEVVPMVNNSGSSK